MATPLRDHVSTKAGWLVFFYEDFNGDVVACNFRQIEKDDKGKNVIRLFNPITKKGVFNSWLYGGTQRVLVGEGEFNCLRYMSEVCRAHGKEWRDYVQDNITVGGSSAVDIKTLGGLLTHYDRVPVIAEDNDKAGAGVTTKVAQGGRKTLHFSFEGKPANYDLDNYFGDAANGQKAVEEVHNFIKTAEPFVRPLSELALELDKIRNGKEIVEELDEETGKTKAKVVTLPAHVVDKKVLAFVLNNVQARGEMYVSTYAYLYTHDEKRLMRFQKDSEDMSEMLRQLNLYLTQPHYRLVQANIENYILTHGTATTIHKLGAFLDGNFYVNKGDGKNVQD